MSSTNPVNSVNSCVILPVRTKVPRPRRISISAESNGQHQAKGSEAREEERGLVVALTRADDTYVSLLDRATMANNQPESVFVSIHFDDAGRTAANGVETYYATHALSFPERVASWLPFLQRTSSDPPNLESQSLAASIQESLVAQTQAANRGTRPQQFYVIANVRHPAVLIEGGFLTNKDEAVKLANAEYREQMAIGIADGILKYRDALLGKETPLAVDLPAR